MRGLRFSGWWRWTHHFLLVIWLLLLAATPPKVDGFFLGDTKAVLKGYKDHWTLQDWAAMPLLLEMTLCVDIRVVVPGAWVAFSYSSVHAPRPELGLEGDDEALYAWLLRVRHRFPIRLSQTHWHRMCLRRDVTRNSFSLEVDGQMVAERTVIARAIPPGGSLWLGCRPRDRPRGAALGEVELYLFRMWEDTGDHGPCEDGSVIGWDAQFWGVTSPRARQRDPHLLCALTAGVGRIFSPPPEVPSSTTTSSPVIATPVTHVSTRTSEVTANHSEEQAKHQNSSVTPSTLTTLTPVNQTRASSPEDSTVLPFTVLLVDRTTPGRSFMSDSPLVHCNISQFCSNENAYYWMSVSVEVGGSGATEQDVHDLVSDTFGCRGNGGDAAGGITGFMDFCQGDGQLQEVLVDCRAKSITRETTCDVLLQLSHAVSACDLQRAGRSALQRAGDEHMQVVITREVQRVGRDVCGDARPSGGGFVRCTSTSSLHEMCQSERRRSGIACYFVVPDSDTAPVAESCSSEAPRFCDCTAFCNSSRQFYAIRININVSSFNVKSLKQLLSGESVAGLCKKMSWPKCQDIQKHYQQAHLECHGTQQRLYGCMAIVEVSGPVDGCFLNELLQQIIDGVSGITNERPLTRMVVCGPPGLDISSLLASHQSWVASDLLTSEVCQPDPALLKCCPPEPTFPSQPIELPLELTNSNTTKAFETSVTTTTEQMFMMAGMIAESQHASQGLAQTYMTSPPAIANVAQYNDTVSTNHTAEYNATATDNNRNNGTNTTISTFTASPNYTTVNNVTTVFNNSVTDETIATTTISENKTATVNVTTTPITETQHNTTAPSKNMTTFTAAAQVNVTLNNATTSTKNSTVDNVTSVVGNATEPTEGPPNNPDGNQNDNITTAATVASTITSQPTTGSFDLSSTASSFTSDLTSRVPGVNVTTTAANTSLETTTSTITHTTTPPARINATTAEASLTASTATLQTVSLTNTTTAKPGSASTSTSETTPGQEAREEQANQLLHQTRDASQLNSSQVAQVVADLEKLLDGPTVSRAVGQKVVNVISNLMDGDPQALSASANRLIWLVEVLGLKLVVAGDKEILSSGSLVLAVKEIDGTNFPVTFMDIFSTDNVQFRVLGRSRFKRSGSAVGSVVLPSSLTAGLSPEQQKQANRVQFNFYTKPVLFQDAALDNQTLVSPVLAASVANMSISNLTENVQFTIRNINPIHENYTASCAFWDFTQNGGGGGWRSAGCFVVNTTPEETTCSCNHLTGFAILLDMSREGMIDRQQAQILTFITFIGCGISAIFLALTLLTYLSFEKLLRDIPAKILVQRCLSLLLLNLVFLLDGWLALYPAPGLCISTAFFLHYFLLTSFTWAGLEALHMYLSIVQVFTPYLSKYMLKFSLVGWGVPLLVVIVILAVDRDNYGMVTYGKYTDGSVDDFCWLRNDIAFYVGVVAYFLLIFALCLLVFVVVMIQLSRIKKQNPQNQPPNRGVMTDVRSIAGLVLLLGLTWGFALFAWGPLYLPFVYLFSIINSLQGFFVFVFHCAVKESVRRQWRTYLCCGKLRVAENSDWSRVATRCNNNSSRPKSVVMATASAPGITSRSTSVISDGTVSSDSGFVDSGLSHGSSSYHLVNEIHRRTTSP